MRVILPHELHEPSMSCGQTRWPQWRSRRCVLVDELVILLSSDSSVGPSLNDKQQISWFNNTDPMKYVIAYDIEVIVEKSFVISTDIKGYAERF